MTWMTLEQFKAWAQHPKCSHCDKKATWMAHIESPKYCDDHYPYAQENEKNEHDDDVMSP